MWREKTAQASGNSGSRKRPSAGADANKVDQDLSDTASSPVKMASLATEVGETDSGARKTLVLEKVPPPPPVYQSPWEKKRAKKAEVTMENTSNDGAGSLEE
jgi:hypothetical protein